MKILSVIDEYGLGGVVRWILENNPSQALPYHNFNHSLYVAVNAHNAYRFTKHCAPPKELIIAALFHDFDHSGGFFGNDRKNIERAINGVRKWQGRANGITVDKVELLIASTEYPYENARNPTSREFRLWKTDSDCIFEVQCLRDADMMQNCNDTLFGNFVGIKHEMFREMPYPEYTEKTLDFLRGIKYGTEYGQEFGVALLNQAIMQMEIFRNMVFSQ